MSECTKGKIRADIKSGCIISDKGFMICDVGFVNTHPVANAKELVRRWNAFEEGGLVEELRIALENALTTLAIISMPRQDDNVATDTELLKILGDSFKAALAKS